MRRVLFIAAVAVCLTAACTEHPDPPVSFITGLRVLAVRAEPPEIPVGATSQVTILAVDTGGRAIEVAWSRCLVAPRAGEAVNPACVRTETGPELQPLGNGMMIGVEMPAVSDGELGQPDATNGVYLPVVARASADADAVTAVYRLRLGGAAPPNMNPTITSIDVVDATGAQPLDEAAPLVVHAGEDVTLQSTNAPGSAEMYTAFGGKVLTETLTTAWFTTAGDLSNERTSDKQPQTVLHLTERLPDAGKTIDIYAVVHDERGGVGYIHRALAFQ
jgi:hypothetical protein